MNSEYHVIQTLIKRKETNDLKDQVKLGVYSVCKLLNCPKPVITGDYNVEFEAS